MDTWNGCNAQDLAGEGGASDIWARHRIMSPEGKWMNYLDCGDNALEQFTQSENHDVSTTNVGIYRRDGMIWYQQEPVRGGGARHWMYGFEEGELSRVH